MNDTRGSNSGSGTSEWLVAMMASRDANEIAAVVEAACEHFEAGYVRIAAEIDEKHLRGRAIVEVSARVPGLADFVYGQWQVLKAMEQVIELRVQAATQKARKRYIEHYDRNLGSTQVENYAKAEPEVLALSETAIRLGLITSHWEGLSKGVEKLHHQLRILSDIRRVGMDDLVI